MVSPLMCTLQKNILFCSSQITDNSVVTCSFKSYQNSDYKIKYYDLFIYRIFHRVNMLLINLVTLFLINNCIIYQIQVKIMWETTLYARTCPNFQEINKVVKNKCSKSVVMWLWGGQKIRWSNRFQKFIREELCIKIQTRINISIET